MKGPGLLYVTFGLQVRNFCEGGEFKGGKKLVFLIITKGRKFRQASGKMRKSLDKEASAQLSESKVPHPALLFQGRVNTPTSWALDSDCWVHIPALPLLLISLCLLTVNT